MNGGLLFNILITFGILVLFVVICFIIALIIEHYSDHRIDYSEPANTNTINPDIKR